MLEQLFFLLCKVFRKSDKLAWAEVGAMLVSTFIIIVSHTLFTIIIFNYDFLFLVDDYGFELLTIDLLVFLLMHTFLIKKFRSYAKKEMDKR